MDGTIQELGRTPEDFDHAIEALFRAGCRDHRLIAELYAARDAAAQRVERPARR